jgi:WD40 repeat protein
MVTTSTFDCRPVYILQPLTLLFRHQVLSADWCKYNDCMIATGSVDKSIKIWDVRMPEREVATLLGHE